MFIKKFQSGICWHNPGNNCILLTLLKYSNVICALCCEKKIVGLGFRKNDERL